MSPLKHLERALDHALKSHESEKGPALLSKAIRHAVFPGGARIRPQLTLAVAQACGNDDPQLSMASAIAIEMMHCASLVHDDLPCFDDADMRRGQTSVHKEYGERLAVLTGDALIVMAYQTIAAASRRSSQRLAPIIQTISQGVGAPFGIIAGQAWECEPQAVLSDYQRAKTGALFSAATAAARFDFLPLGSGLTPVSADFGVWLYWVLFWVLAGLGSAIGARLASSVACL